MSILGGRLEVAARVGRTLSNALLLAYDDRSGTEFATARQKGGVGVLLGFKNGGTRTRFAITGAESALDVTVGDTTTVERDGAPLGCIVGEKLSARVESAGGTMLAQMNPCETPTDGIWPHPLTAPDGRSLGTLTLMRTVESWGLVEFLNWTENWNRTGQSLKPPSAGAVLQLAAPVNDVLGDLLIAALLDISTLPRGYSPAGS
jgi:hypothetical protein